MRLTTRKGGEGTPEPASSLSSRYLKFVVRKDPFLKRDPDELFREFCAKLGMKPDRVLALMKADELTYQEEERKKRGLDRWCNI